LRNPFINKRLEYVDSIVKKGSDISSEKSNGDYIILKDIQTELDYRKHWFTTDTKIILGTSKVISETGNIENGKGCTVEWIFDLKKITGGKIINAQLNIKSSRTNSGLHTSKQSALEALHELSAQKRDKPKYASIRINEKELDTIFILSRMESQLSDEDFPNGLESFKDYGYNKVGPYDVTSIIMSLQGKKEFRLSIATDTNVYWDIDEISVENIIIERNEMSQFFWMIVGAFISAIIGLIGSILMG